MADAHVSERPTIMITFSMGGLLMKHMLLSQERLREHVKTVLFIGTPHLGSDVIVDTGKKLEGLITGFHPFTNETALHALPKNEFLENFLNNLMLSNTT
jgi:predicted alpha/beta hydrolase family esterase